MVFIARRQDDARLRQLVAFFILKYTSFIALFFLFLKFYLTNELIEEDYTPFALNNDKVENTSKGIIFTLFASFFYLLQFDTKQNERRILLS